MSTNPSKPMNRNSSEKDIRENSSSDEFEEEVEESTSDTEKNIPDDISSPDNEFVPAPNQNIKFSDAFNSEFGGKYNPEELSKYGATDDYCVAGRLVQEKLNIKETDEDNVERAILESSGVVPEAEAEMEELCEKSSDENLECGATITLDDGFHKMKIIASLEERFFDPTQIHLINRFFRELALYVNTDETEGPILDKSKNRGAIVFGYVESKYQKKQKMTKQNDDNIPSTSRNCNKNVCQPKSPPPRSEGVAPAVNPNLQVILKDLNKGLKWKHFITQKELSFKMGQTGMTVEEISAVLEAGNEIKSGKEYVEYLFKIRGHFNQLEASYIYQP
ncbi:polymerase-associated protein [Drosophila obscura sigmavirus 10A]|uniref:Polymerase-associated protein n=1 Tax=Drosophila obscura sigmavirus TaxID=948741 RepID=C8CJE7_9RHAB|nr:polymerase-associated protein [Drosophila obscura sigmavirus 10A]ACU65440.1 polymerase-associated protein [Drosophila obscura sigmavirus 10A]